MNLTGAFYGLLAFAIFATHDVVIKILGGAYSPFQMVFFATLFSFPLVTFILMRDKTEGNLHPVHPWWTLVRTLCAVFTALGGFYAFTVLPLAQVYAILFATPLLITLLSIPILGEKVGLHRWLAVIVGLVGVIVVLRPGTTELSLGHLAALTCACFGALASIVVRKIGREERPIVLMLYPMAANFFVMGGLMSFHYQPLPFDDLAALGAIALLGVTGGLLLVVAYRNSEAAVVAPMQYSQIIWATIFGYFLFGETLDVPTILGASIIIASGLYILFRESRGGKSRNKPVLESRSRVAPTTSLRLSALLRREESDKP